MSDTGPPNDLWRVDVAGIPVMVKGKPSYEFLQSINTERARMKLALHRILKMDPEEWGKQGIYTAQKIARDGLERAP
jgi:hypothetical protein